MTQASAAAREAAVAGLLDAVTGSSLEAWLVDVRRPRSDPGVDDALRVLAVALLRDWTGAIDLHRSLRAPDPADAVAVRLRAGAGAWALSGDPTGRSAEGLEAITAVADPLAGGPVGRVATYLLVEGCLAHARLDLATELAARAGVGLWEPLELGGARHDFTTMMAVCRVRLLAFAGEVAAAGEALQGIEPGPRPTLAALVHATGTLVRGNDADPGEARRLAALVSDLVPEPVDHLTAGSHLLVAFGLVAIGDVAAAAERLLTVGRDARLAALNAVDRALGLELLVALAVAEGDLDAAQAWRESALELMGSPIADSTVLRLLARVALLEGDAAAAQVLAERAVARATETGRGIERAEAEIVLNAARLQGAGPGARAEAVRCLAAMVEDAEGRGHRSARRSASRTLRPLGLRLPPLAGSGLAGLTEREAEVARWVAGGASNREVAERLVVSEHTVRAHVSRVLAAFGVATRSGLPAALGERLPCAARPALTGRQQQVATLVARGCGNREIAEELGLSVRTVERHVGDILQRWGLPGRTSIARAVLDSAAP